MSGFELFKTLLHLELEYENFDWLENRPLSEFEILISVILTQNTNWNNVLKALNNLKANNIRSLKDIQELPQNHLALLIKPSGFYNTKAKRLKGFANAILRDFKDFEDFKLTVSRQWLLNIKGISFESADSVLNYLCKREILVVDSYSNRIALAMGYEFESYDELRMFFESDIETNQEKLCILLNKKYELYQLYQIFHALLISFAKKYSKAKSINEEGKAILRGAVGET